MSSRGSSIFHSTIDNGGDAIKAFSPIAEQLALNDFTSPTTLVLENLVEDEWDGSVSFSIPKLETLTIVECHSLTKLGFLSGIDTSSSAYGMFAPYVWNIRLPETVANSLRSLCLYYSALDWAYFALPDYFRILSCSRLIGVALSLPQKSR